ncbi:MAG: hypothetical protein HN712_24515 [Gemmatimonadetes bacterium]|jgi:hypothetical protein|nr:hypothetical protein [Gemmatimonadota bacterium]MBT6145583.1 hypothetical protein [Gemmatimonadota bacterium]MBT7863502.1 hypothetical protein [Gemmatimonadota bacterium]
MDTRRQRALQRKLLPKGKTLGQLSALLDPLLPHLTPPISIRGWDVRVQRTRQQVLDLFFEGHPTGLLDEAPRVQWRGTIQGDGYRIRKLRYEGYPGMWVPALLYEPEKLSGRMPVVLNPNGHHAGGKAMDYKQARCINLARRGMIALNTEFIGMGELRADVDHQRIGMLDAVGVAGIGIFYLLMKRGLDALLAHRHADPKRVAMTGLSGGGWQTALLSALDERITHIVPVAGHSPVWQRRGCQADIGDLEQCPSDLCTILDYDTLTAMFAPRPALLIYNHEDDCCFQTRRTKHSIYRPARAVYEQLGVGDQISMYDNVDPGTHNYERDSRRQLYRFLDQHFGLVTPDDDLPFEQELRTESELEVGLPEDNATLMSLALGHLHQIRRQRQRRKPLAPAAARRQLRQLLRLDATAAGKDGSIAVDTVSATGGGVTQLRLHIDGWSVPVTELTPAPTSSRRPGGVEIILNDAGRAGSQAAAARALAQGRRVLVIDLLGTGECLLSHQYHMVAACAGLRPLGLQTRQLMRLIEWARKRYRVKKVDLHASGTLTPVVALLAAALEPKQIGHIELSGYLGSLDRLIDQPMSYATHAPLYCFGLLRQFDLPDLLRLAAGVTIRDANRGPL